MFFSGLRLQLRRCVCQKVQTNRQKLDFGGEQRQLRRHGYELKRIRVERQRHGEIFKNFEKITNLNCKHTMMFT